MGKRGPKQWVAKKMELTFPFDMVQRIESVIQSTESRTEFVRQAVEHEIQRRAECAKIATPKRKG